MVDSPSPSPKLDSFISSKPKVSSNLVPQPQDYLSKPEGSEFLDLEDDDDDTEDGELYEDEVEFRSAHGQNQSKADLAVRDSRADHNAVMPDQQSISNVPAFTNPFQDSPNHSQDTKQIRVPSEDLSSSYLQQSQLPESGTDQSTRISQVVPGPNQSPININSSSSFGPPSQLHHHTQLHQQPPQVGTSQSNYPTGSPQPVFPSSRQMSQQQGMPLAAPPRTDSRPVERTQHSLEPTSTLNSLESSPLRKRDVDHYRALPLLPTDLPTTVVSVSQSFVRPNDRGKEVLSFVITVNPGNGKEPWKVEKMYSDVVALDSRVRASVGKSVAKKITGLPEGKLWRDHAPAKVDQRKVREFSFLFFSFVFFFIFFIFYFYFFWIYRRKSLTVCMTGATRVLSPITCETANQE
jgi:RalA-binding protein 1